MHIMRKLTAGLWLALLLPLVLSFSTPERLVATGSAVHAAPVTGAISKDTTETFRVTPVGQTSTICTGFCYCNGPCPRNGCDASGSGTARSSHFPSPPFRASGFVLEPFGSVDCSAGTPVQLPVTVGVGQQIAFTLSFSPSAPGTFTDYFDMDKFIFHLAGSTPRGSASILPYQPPGWSAPVVVSRTQGTQMDSSTLTNGELLYVSWAVQNAGDLSTFGTFHIDLYLDGTLSQRWSWADPLPPHNFIYLKDHPIGSLAPGPHMLELVPDSTHTIGSSQGYKKAFTVAQSTALPKPPPPAATSWYIYVTSNETDKALNSWMYNAGYQYGQNAVRRRGFVVLDFGQPWQSGKIYGTWSFDPRFGRFLSISTIREAVKQYVRGFVIGAGSSGSTSVLWLGVGTNNYGPYVTGAHGKAWGTMITSIQSWLDESGAAKGVVLRSASDIELGYSTPGKVSSWLGGYTSANRTHSTFNYGDAQGCPQSGTTNVPKACSGQPGWTQDEVINNTLFLLPEIYSTAGGNAKQWQQLILYNYLRYNFKTVAFGATSQKQACDQRGGCQALGIDNTPAQAWTQLRDRLASDPRTLTVDPYFSTDFRWRK